MTEAPDTLPSDSGALAPEIAALAARLEQAAPLEIIAAGLGAFPGRIAAVSSFGTESVVLLHMIAEVNAATPIIFLDTGHLFPETLTYRDTLIERLKLTGVLTVQPDPAALAARDPDTALWSDNPDACCAVRKVEPLARALSPFAAWINGRKRYQAATRAAIAAVEADGPRVKFNPLAAMGREDLLAYIRANDLPAHPLERFGFPSVGCMPCTSRVADGEDSRSGRWRGKAKTECGIHTAPAL